MCEAEVEGDEETGGPATNQICRFTSLPHSILLYCIYYPDTLDIART